MGPDYFFKGVTFGYYARNGYFSSEAARCEAETASMRPYFWNSGKSTTAKSRQTIWRQ